MMVQVEYNTLGRTVRVGNIWDSRRGYHWILERAIEALGRTDFEIVDGIESIGMLMAVDDDGNTLEVVRVC